MVCSKCGAVLKEGCVYCSQCGQEAQIVSEISILEDDLLQEMMDEKESQGTKKKAGPSRDDRDEKEKRRKRQKGRREIRRNLIVCIVLLAVALTAGFGTLKYRQNHSVEYLMDKAQAAYGQKDYQAALKYLNRLLSLDGEEKEALLLAGEINIILKDYELAEEELLSVLDLDASSPEAYQYLIRLYAAQGDRDKILALMEGIADEGLLALFEDYIVPAPEISVKGGRFSEYFTVEITAEDRTLEIYYTLDGSDPTEDAVLYENPVEISEQGEFLLTAVCMDSEGYYSDTVSEKYVVELTAPDMPSASPDGGQFTEAVSVTVTVPEGTTVYYTWDGSAPDQDSSRYTEPIEVPEGNHILSVIAIDSYGMKSEVLKCNYIYYPEDVEDTVEDGTSEEDEVGEAE